MIRTKDTRTLASYFVAFTLISIVWPSRAHSQVSKPTPRPHLGPNTKIKENEIVPPLQVPLSGPATGNDATARFPKEVVVTIEAKRSNFPLDVKLYEVHPSELEKIFLSRNVKDVKTYIPTLAEVKDNKLVFLGPSSKALAYVIENKSDKPMYFFVAPHGIAPAADGLGVKWKCLCLGEVFRIRPRHTWVRVTELRLLSQNRASKLAVAHEFVGVAEGDSPPGESN